jgi:AhpD family alkylhydroperoxidase
MMTNMKPRLSHFAAAPEGVQALMAFSRYSAEGSLDEKLLALIDLRASQMNGCAFCAVLHANDARDAGESEDRLTAVSVWRDTPWFSKRERIALEWTERLTDLVHSEIDDELYESALAEFGERGLTDLTIAVATVNAWNRLNVPFRTPPDPKFRSKSLAMRR